MTTRRRRLGRPLAAFYHFGASRKAFIAWSITFQERQIEGWPCWQNGPMLRARKLCCLDEDLKTNIFGSRPAFIKMKVIYPNGHFGGFLWGAPIEFQFFYFSRVLVDPPIVTISTICCFWTRAVNDRCPTVGRGGRFAISISDPKCGKKCHFSVTSCRNPEIFYHR